MHPQGATPLMRKEVFLLGHHPGRSHFNVISVLLRRMHSGGGFHAVQNSLELLCPLTFLSTGRWDFTNRGRSVTVSSSWRTSTRAAIIPVSEVMSRLV